MKIILFYYLLNNLLNYAHNIIKEAVMEKTNELNKLISYIHMGNCIYRIYLEHALELEDESLIKEIKSIQSIFKKHEDTINSLIEQNGEESAGLMGIYKEKLKSFDNTYSICKAAIKSTNIGMLSTIKFLKENENLSQNIKEKIEEIINDYLNIQKIMTLFILNNCIK